MKQFWTISSLLEKGDDLRKEEYFFSILRCSEASKRWRLTGWKLWCSGWVVDGAQEGKRTRGQGDYGGQGDAAEAKTWCFVTVDSPTRPPPTPLLPQIPLLLQLSDISQPFISTITRSSTSATHFPSKNSSSVLIALYFWLSFFFALSWIWWIKCQEK